MADRRRESDSDTNGQMERSTGRQVWSDSKLRDGRFISSRLSGLRGDERLVSCSFQHVNLLEDQIEDIHPSIYEKDTSVNYTVKDVIFYLGCTM